MGSLSRVLTETESSLMGNAGSGLEEGLKAAGLMRAGLSLSTTPAAPDGQQTHRAKLGICSVLIHQLAMQEAVVCAKVPYISLCYTFSPMPGHLLVDISCWSQLFTI